MHFDTVGVSKGLTADLTGVRLLFWTIRTQVLRVTAAVRTVFAAVCEMGRPVAARLVWPGTACRFFTF